MAVSGLQQRFQPIVVTTSVWSPWGPGRVVPWSIEEYDDENVIDEDHATCGLKRVHSWSNFSTYDQLQLCHSSQEFFGLGPVKHVHHCTLDEGTTSEDASTSVPASEAGTSEHDIETRPKNVILNESVTTLVIRNLPFSMSQDDLLQAIDASGFAGSYDFVYLPHKFKEHRNVGFGFINFLNADIAQQFAALWHQSQSFRVKGTLKAVNISEADVQGRDANQHKALKMSRVRNSYYRPLVIGTSESNNV